MESYHIIIIAIAVSGSAVIKNSVGIGAGVFLLPVLTLVLPPKVALGLGAPAMLISDLVGIKNYWGEWDKREQAFQQKRLCRHTRCVFCNDQPVKMDRLYPDRDTDMEYRYFRIDAFPPDYIRRVYRQHHQPEVAIPAIPNDRIGTHPYHRMSTLHDGLKRESGHL